MLRFNELIKNKKLMSGIYAVTLITALLILALVIKGPEKSGSLIADGSGNIVGIRRKSLQRSERYDLELEIDTGDEIMSRDVTLTLQASKKPSSSGKLSESETRAAEIDAEIDSVISGIEYSSEKKINLPASLSDGSSVRWKASEQKSGPLLVIIPLIYVSLVAIMTVNTLRDDGKAAEIRKYILRGLPRFCNQLYLMMNAGLILSDAFDMISANCGIRDGNTDLFEKDIAGLREATMDHRVSAAQVLNEYAVRNNVKEMIRIAAILNENEKRGSDVVEDLARESRYLWDERKIVARECGKSIDTKMSYPLGLLLIILIVITITPALLNM